MSVMVLMIMKSVRHGQCDTDPPTGVESSEVEIMAVKFCERMYRSLI